MRQCRAGADTVIPNRPSLAVGVGAGGIGSARIAA
jgi:hypothetical protein